MLCLPPSLPWGDDHHLGRARLDRLMVLANERLGANLEAGHVEVLCCYFYLGGSATCTRKEKRRGFVVPGQERGGSSAGGYARPTVLNCEKSFRKRAFGGSPTYLLKKTCLLCADLPTTTHPQNTKKK